MFDDVEAAAQSRARQASAMRRGAKSPCIECPTHKSAWRLVEQLRSQLNATKRQLAHERRVRTSSGNYPDKIYVMGCLGEDLVKIGISHDVEGRRNSLAKPTSRSEQAMPGLRILFQREIGYSARKFERFCHGQLRNVRTEGEWFKISADEVIGKLNIWLADWKED